MGELAAVVGIGQTKYASRRGDVSIAGLVREAAQNALEDADLSFKAIDVFSEDFKEQSYDIVLCTLFLHHFKNNELILFLKTLIIDSE